MALWIGYSGKTFSKNKMLDKMYLLKKIIINIAE